MEPEGAPRPRPFHSRLPPPSGRAIAPAPRALLRHAALRLAALRAPLPAPPPATCTRPKYETQGVTDTQMMDAADGAEAVIQMISNKGMTQTFDTFFQNKVDSRETESPKLCRCKNKADETCEIFQIKHLGLTNTIFGEDNKGTERNDIKLSHEQCLEVLDKNDCDAIGEESKKKLLDEDNFHSGKVTSNLMHVIRKEMEGTKHVLNDKPAIISESVMQKENVYRNKTDQDRSTSPILTPSILKRKGSNSYNIDYFHITDVENQKDYDNINMVIGQNRSASRILSSTVSKKHKFDRKETNSYNMFDFEKFENVANEILHNNQEYMHDNYVEAFMNKKEVMKQINERVHFNKNNDSIVDIGQNECSNNKVVTHNNINKVKGVHYQCKSNPQVNEHIILEDMSNKPIVDGVILSSSKEQFISEPRKEIMYLCNASNILETSEDSVIMEKSLYVGFATASNKSIQVSCESFENAKGFLGDIIQEDSNSEVNEDIEDEVSSMMNQALVDETMSEHDVLKELESDILGVRQDEQNDTDKHKSFNNVNTEVNLIGFQTANNNVINLSENALAKTKNIFQEYHNVQGNLINLRLFEASNAPQFEGFTTASNKTIMISGKALAKSKKLFVDIPDVEEIFNQGMKEVCDVTTPQEKSLHSKLSNKLSFDSYKTANKIQEKSLPKCNQLSEDIEESKKNLEETPKFQGFTTASNKYIRVSEKALAKTKKLFQGIDDSLEANHIINESDFRESEEFQGFTTASDTKIKICENVIAHTKNLYDIADFEDNGINKKFAEGKQIHGFTTASNKSIHVSKNALAKTKNFFHDIDEETEEFEKGNLNMESSKFEGFTTGSNKNKNYSEKAIAKTKNLFDNENLFPNSQKFGGFSTASNKSITVSKQTLAKPKSFFHDIEVINIPQEHNKFQGFTTGNNKIIEVSQQAIAKTKNIFEDDLFPNSQKFGGFSTGNNKSTTVSKDALNKTKNFFNSDNKIESTAKFHSISTGNNKNVEVSKEAIKKTRNLFGDLEELKESNDFIKPISDKYKNKNANKQKYNTKKPETPEHKPEEDHLNTQVKNHFEQTMYTEDFASTQKRKSPRSPIISCPNAKRRKVFKVPYNTQQKLEIECDKKIEEIVLKTATVFEFNECYKESNRLSLQKLKDIERKYVKEKTSINFEDLNDLLNFEFKNERNNLTHTELTMSGLRDIFINSVDKSIVPEGWLDNHIKLILWKLLSYEVFFSNNLSNVATAENVLRQLKYRYDREVYRVERPALRKILEKDESPGRTIVLCVVKVCDGGQETSGAANTELEVTDGWYCVRASIDKMLCRAVAGDRIVSGCKLVTHGAELVNCEQGRAPWEDVSSVRLKLSGNATRRAPWYARLGFHGSAGVLVPLHSITPEGGRVGRVRVLVARVYPMLFVEKFEDGSTVTRSERLEALHSAAYESERQSKLERMCETIERELLDVDALSQDSQEEYTAREDTGKRSAETGSQIVKVMKRCRDPMEFTANLTESQINRINEYTSKKRDQAIEEMRRRIQERIDKSGLNDIQRKVVPLLKIRVVSWDKKSNETSKDVTNQLRDLNVKVTADRTIDIGNSSTESIEHDVDMSSAWLSIWKPGENLLDIIKEGIWLDCMNVVPTALRMSEIHISAGSQSIFNKSRHQNTKHGQINNVLRKYTKISDLSKKIIFDEVDTAGLVFEVEPSSSDFESKPARIQNFQNVYLTDSDKNFVCINFWGGLKKFGYEKTLDTGQFVACSNLQKRMGNSGKTIPQFRVTEFTVFTKVPKSLNSVNALKELRRTFESVDVNNFCKECLRLKNSYSTHKNRNIENMSPFGFNRSEYNLSKNKMFIDSYEQNNEFNLNGLDFDSTFRQESQNTEQAKRRALIQSKMRKLEMYGEPPPLSPMHIINKSLNVSNQFKSPISEATDISNVSSVKRTEIDIVNAGSSNITNAYKTGIELQNVEKVTSDDKNTVDHTINNKEKCDLSTPLVIRNNAAIRRSFVNPVKLNFSSENVARSSKDSSVASRKESDKDFEEDFEYSPPLSLDTVMF